MIFASATLYFSVSCKGVFVTSATTTSFRPVSLLALSVSLPSGCSCLVLPRSSTLLGGCLHLFWIESDKIFIGHATLRGSQFTEKDDVPSSGHAPTLQEMPGQLARTAFELTIFGYQRG